MHPAYVLIRINRADAAPALTFIAGGLMARFGDILLVADADNRSPEAYERALKLALRNKGRLTVLNIIEELPHRLSGVVGNTAHKLTPNAIVDRTERLKQLIEEQTSVVPVEIHVVYGNSSDDVIHEVVQNGHDLLIIADRNEFRGPTAVQLVRKSPCSVWLIGSDARTPYRRIMAAVDPDPYNADRESLNTKILRTAASFARAEAVNCTSRMPGWLSVRACCVDEADSRLGRWKNMSTASCKSAPKRSIRS
jgi:nucleotide-binding universal stress UspA family protein